MKSSHAVALPLLACPLLALAACSRPAPAAPVPPAVRVEVVAAAASSSGGAVYSAVAQPAAQVPLAFRGPGYLAAVMQVKADGRLRPLGEGDRVRRGDVLARLRDTEYRDKLQQATGQAAAARAAAQKAVRDFERAARLFASQTITKADFEGAQAQRDATAAQLSSAEAVLAEAQMALKDTALTAPIDGDVLKKNAEPGAFTGPGVPAFVLADVSRIKVVLGVPDVALQGVAPGAEVAVTCDALPGKRFTARVSRIASAADPATRNFDVEIELANAQRLWRPGMIATAALAGSPGRAPSALLPLSAFVEASPGTERFAVVVVEGDGPGARARIRPVELGAISGNRVAVERGLAPGERVIVTGASIVSDGERVEVVPSEAQ
jgi:RND family efflux transporter MFP subunit